MDVLKMFLSIRPLPGNDLASHEIIVFGVFKGALREWGIYDKEIDKGKVVKSRGAIQFYFIGCPREDANSKLRKLTFKNEENGETLTERISIDPELWTSINKSWRKLKFNGEDLLVRLKALFPGDGIETADLFIMPQTINDTKERRDSPFYRPEEPAIFIEDPGWGAKDPGNASRGLPEYEIEVASSSGPKLLRAVFAGEVIVRGIPGSDSEGKQWGPYKFGIAAKGDAGKWITIEDPNIWIDP